MFATDSKERPRAVLVGVQLPGVSDAELEASLTELKRLVQTLGFDVVGRVTQKQKGVGSGSVLGKGKLVELAGYTGGTGIVPKGPPKKHGREDDDDDELDLEELPDADALEPPSDNEPPRASVVVVDHELSPRQLRNLEKATSAQVLDRTGVIVEIFHRHASSRQARLQVEIARLAYTAPRVRESSNTERQRGGIGGKGAGESALELDRRKIRDRIAELRAELLQIHGESDVRRARRREQLRVALVGYTNAGKSSMMRALTGSDVLVADKLFATLDTTVRALYPETRPRILVSDTVGFIKKLPHDLVASFRSTLDEALEASLLLYVVDASDPDFRSQLAVTRQVLGEIGADDVDSMLVLNKADRLDDDARDALRREYPDALIVSAKDQGDVARVRDTIIAAFQRDMSEAELLVPYTAQGVVGELRKRATIVSESYENEGVRFVVRASQAALERIRHLMRDGQGR